MSAATMTANSPRERTTPATAEAGVKKARRRHTPGGALLGKGASREAQQRAAAILEVLAGARTPVQAAEALGVSLPRYFQLETRAMQALVAGCESRPRGRGHSLDKELAALKRQHERLEREFLRQQTLVRLAQRTIGLAPAKQEPAKPGGEGKRKKRRPAVRALRAARELQGRSQEEAALPSAAPSTREDPL
jgi:hypothetical protein